MTVEDVIKIQFNYKHTYQQQQITCKERQSSSVSNTNTMQDRKLGLIPVCPTSLMCICWKEHMTTLFRIWLQDGGVKPSASTSDQLRITYSGTLNPLKSLSDQIIYHPVKYKILFGSNADEALTGNVQGR